MHLMKPNMVQSNKNLVKTSATYLGCPRGFNIIICKVYIILYYFLYLNNIVHNDVPNKGLQSPEC